MAKSKSAAPKASTAKQSMTGFGRAQMTANGVHGVSGRVEIKSVNARGLEIKLRLPNQCDQLEPQIRKAISQKLKRGHLQLNAQIDDAHSTAIHVLNEAQLTHTLGALGALAKITEQLGLEVNKQISLTELMSSQGMMVPQRTDMGADENKVVEQAVLDLVDQALNALVAARQTEGEQIAAFLNARLSDMAKIIAEIEKLPARSPEAIREKFQAQFLNLVEEKNGLDEERLHQEASLLAIKADVREELDRFAAHIETALGLLKGATPIGRKLDFLSQELNREANTLCAKSNDVGMTRLGVELKTLVDQFREQVQNLE